MNSRQRRKHKHAWRKEFKHVEKASRRFGRAVGIFFDSIRAFQDQAVQAVIDTTKDGRA